MQTSFAVKQANDKILQTLKVVDQLYQDLDERIERCAPIAQIDDSLRTDASDIYARVDYKKLIELFLQFSEEEMVLESIALSRLLDSIPECQNVVISHKAFDKYLDSKFEQGSKTHSALQLLKILYSLPICYKAENQGCLVEYLRRFRYKPELFRAVAQFIPEIELTNILKDLNFNFVHYATSVYGYYCEFYKRGESVEPAMLESLESLKHYEKVEFILERVHSDPNAKLAFKFEVNLSEPVEHILESLNDFRNNLALFVMDAYEDKKVYSEAPYHILNDYIRDKAGKIVNHDDLSKLFAMWHRVLAVYDLRKTGKSYGQIKQRLGVKDPSKDVKKAEELILSATRGTFPD